VDLNWCSSVSPFVALAHGETSRGFRPFKQKRRQLLNLFPREPVMSGSIGKLPSSGIFCPFDRYVADYRLLIQTQISPLREDTFVIFSSFSCLFFRAMPKNHSCLFARRRQRVSGVHFCYPQARFSCASDSLVLAHSAPLARIANHLSKASSALCFSLKASGKATQRDCVIKRLRSLAGRWQCSPHPIHAPGLAR
jgi:hypothetical protein